MGRKRMNPNDKKTHFGISIHPEIIKLLKIQSDKENKSKSQLIEDVMKDYLKNKI